jgi:hypothetical protein
MGYLTEDKRSIVGAFGSLFRRGAGAELNQQQSQAAAKADVFLAVGFCCCPVRQTWRQTQRCACNYCKEATSLKQYSAQGQNLSTNRSFRIVKAS